MSATIGEQAVEGGRGRQGARLAWDLTYRHLAASAQGGIAYYLSASKTHRGDDTARAGHDTWSTSSSSVGSRARATRGVSVAMPRRSSTSRTIAGAVTSPSTRRRPPHLAHSRTSTEKLRRNRDAQSPLGVAAYKAPPRRRSQCFTLRTLGVSICHAAR